MKMTLYEIDEAIINCIDTETGEILDAEKLDELSMARDTKIENIALYIKSLKADADAIKAKENRAESLKEYLYNALNGEPFETAKVRLSFRGGEAVDITDEFAVVEYLEKNSVEKALTYSMPKISKTVVGELLKQGIEIPGAVLKQNNNLQIK